MSRTSRGRGRRRAAASHARRDGSGRTLQCPRSARRHTGDSRPRPTPERPDSPFKSRREHTEPRHRTTRKRKKRASTSSRLASDVRLFCVWSGLDDSSSASTLPPRPRRRSAPPSPQQRRTAASRRRARVALKTAPATSAPAHASGTHRAEALLPIEIGRPVLRVAPRLGVLTTFRDVNGFIHLMELTEGRGQPCSQAATSSAKFWK